MTEAAWNERGNYRFLPAISPYSSGVIADDDFQIEHVALDRPVVLDAGLRLIDSYLTSRGLRRQSLCNLQLRSPRAFSFEGFAKFNANYQRFLTEWDLLVDGLNPIARTNVVPAVGAPHVPCLFAFSFVTPVPKDPSFTSSFVVAGGGEVIEGRLEPDAIVRRGEVDERAILEKADFVVEEMLDRLHGLDVSGDDVTRVNVYTVHSLSRVVSEILAQRLPSAVLHGVHWYYSRPPIEQIEFEMDLRSVAVETIIDTSIWHEKGTKH